VRKRGKRRHLRQPKNNYSGWLFIVGGFAQEARSCFDLAFSFLWISCVQCAETMRLIVRHLFIFSFSR